MPRGPYQRRKPKIGQQFEAAPSQEYRPEAASTRAIETRRERRRRDDGDIDQMARMKLAIPRDVQERANAEGKVLRWMLDTPGRLQQAHADDWDRVEGVDSVAASRNEDGQMILHEKHRDWWESDQRAKTRRLDREEQVLTEGGDRNPETYTPRGETNRIFRKPGV